MGKNYFLTLYQCVKHNSAETKIYHHASISSDIIFHTNGTFFVKSIFTNYDKTVIAMPSRHFTIMKGNYANNMIKIQN